MTSGEQQKSATFADAIEVIESTYELMLAYAAQGRAPEETDPTGLRAALDRVISALDLLDAIEPQHLHPPADAVRDATAAMLAVLKSDVASARAAFRFVCAQRRIGSQMIDNLNASIHVRALLTDIFLLDEALAQIPR